MKELLQGVANGWNNQENILGHTSSHGIFRAYCCFVFTCVGVQFENWLTVNGYDSLLTDSESPILKGIGTIATFLLSSSPRWFVGGAIFSFIADGIWRYWKDSKGFDSSGCNGIIDDLNNNLLDVYKAIGIALGAQDSLYFSLAIVQSESFLLRLAKTNGSLIPDLYKDGAEAGVLRTLSYLNSIVPPLESDNEEEVRRRAAELVPKLNAKSLVELQTDLGLLKSEALVVAGNQLSPSIASASIAVSNIDPKIPQYTYPKAVLQLKDPKIEAEATEKGRISKIAGYLHIQNTSYMTLDQCMIWAVSIEEGGVEQALNSA